MVRSLAVSPHTPALDVLEAHPVLHLYRGDGFGRPQAGHTRRMSIFDKVKGKAADLARDHGEKVAKGVDKAADAANRRTGGQHADKIRDGAERAKRALDDLGNQPPGETGAR